MKKILSILLALSMLFSLGVGSMVYAASTNPSLEVTSVNGKVGNQVTVDVSLKNSLGFGGMAYDVTWDDTVLELISYETDLGKAICTDSGVGTYPNKANFQYASTSNVTGDGVLVSLVFKILDTTATSSQVKVIPEDGTTFYYVGRTETDFTLVEASGTVTIEIPPVAVNGVTLNKETFSLNTGASETLIATVLPDNATNKAVSWESNNTSVATVDNSGKVTAIKKGTASITVKTADGSFTDTCVVSVACSHSGKVFHAEKTNATCQEQNYSAYYLCHCGQYLAEDGTTEIDGVPYTGNGNHNYGSNWDKQSSTETKHYHKCSVCGGLDAGESHTVGSAANCVDKTICGECDKAYGSINSNNHKTPTTFKYIKIDENNHKKLYDCCDALAVASEPHIYDNASDMICNGVGCGYDRTHYCGNGVLHTGFAANCSTMTDGEKDYYVCSCGRKYYDATCLSPVLDEADLVIAWEHTLTHHNPDPASCWENGTVEYWSCSKCNKNFGTSNVQDTNALATTVDPATGNHSFGSTWVDGNDGYHYHVCTTSGCTAKDTANRQEHSGGTATCQEKATCTACGAKHGDKGGHTWSDTYELANADANKHYHICIIAGCTEKDEGEDHTGGTATCEAAKTCSVCTKVYGEKDMNNHTGTATNIVPNNNGTHDIKYTCCGTVKNDDVACSGGTATCVAEAICEHCNTAYGNKNATNHTSDEFTYIDNGDGTHSKKNKCCNAIVGEPEEHNFGDDNICDSCNYDKTHYCGNGTLIKGKAATCTENGVKDSYKCSCGKIYLDATCKTLVVSEDELVIKATGVHADADKNNKCDDCEAIIDKTVTSPQTGDNSNIALWIALAFVSLASLTGLTVYGKKKRNQA